MHERFRRWKDGGIRELARDGGEGGKDDGNSRDRSAPPERDDVGEPGEMQGMLLWESDLLVRDFHDAGCDQENEKLDCKLPLGSAMEDVGSCEHPMQTQPRADARLSVKH